MDPNEIDMLETVEKPNKFYMFIKKVTLHFLLPVSLVSCFLYYNFGFSFFYSYNYQLSTFVFPLFTQVFERKYMFLLCNGILAFLAKNMSFSSSYYPVSEANGEFLEGSEANHKIKEGSEANHKIKESSEAPEEERGAAMDRNKGLQQQAELEKEVEQGDEEAEIADEKEMIYSDAAEDEREGDVSDNGQEDEEGSEEGWGGPIGASPAEDGSTLNMNTEELNRKIEAFIRKMKEEIRIEPQQQLIVV